MARVGSMANPFDREEYPESTPDCLVVSQFLGWKLDLDYDDTDYSLSYELNPVGATDSNNSLSISGTLVALTDGDYWVFEVDSSVSSGYALTKDTEYKWDLILTQTSSTNKTSIQSGFINIFLSSSDRRSHAEIMVAQIDALLEGRAKSDVSSYSIKSRSLTKLSIEELIMWRDYYLNEVRRTGGSAKASSGSTPRPKKNTVQVRFDDDGYC